MKEKVGEVDGINPISTIDEEIIDQVIKLIEMRGGNQGLVGILRKYKHKRDVDVLTELLQYESSMKSEGDEESPTIDFIKIGDEILQAGMLFKIKPVDEWGDDGPVFGLLLNEEPIPEKMNFLQDKVISYESKESRDEALEEIQEKLENYIGARFI